MQDEERMEKKLELCYILGIRDVKDELVSLSEITFHSEKSKKKIKQRMKIGGIKGDSKKNCKFKREKYVGKQSRFTFATYFFFNHIKRAGNIQGKICIMNDLETSIEYNLCLFRETERERER